MHIAILGFGVEGKALLNYFLKQGGYEITVCDEANLSDHVKIKNPKIHWKSGLHAFDNLDQFDLIFRSPGIPVLKKEFSKIREEEKLTSVTRYFFDHCPCPIVGITGTKGKGTTSTLLFKIAEKHYGKRIHLGGNIGDPPLAFLDVLKKNHLVILELSSFQLQDLHKSPHGAVVLDITPDHLDYHKSIQEYIEAKQNIVRHQTKSDFVIVNEDSETARSLQEKTPAPPWGFSRNRVPNRGAFLKVGSIMVKNDETTGTFVCDRSEIPLRGDHNIENVLAAVTAATALGIPLEHISSAVREFQGLPHRLEFVREVKGARYYNDSASTTPETGIAAIQSFHEPLILIAGGSEKNAEYIKLGEAIAKKRNVKSVILIGETKPKIERAIEEAVKREDTRRKLRKRTIPLEIISAETYQEAFMVAYLMAQPGDVVLLSPASASFDMFKNYKERGEIFRRFILDTANQ